MTCETFSYYDKKNGKLRATFEVSNMKYVEFVPDNSINIFFKNDEEYKLKSMVDNQSKKWYDMLIKYIPAKPGSSVKSVVVESNKLNIEPLKKSEGDDSKSVKSESTSIDLPVKTPEKNIEPEGI